MRVRFLIFDIFECSLLVGLVEKMMMKVELIYDQNLSCHTWELDRAFDIEEWY
jgi:hypothetical protein